MKSNARQRAKPNPSRIDEQMVTWEQVNVTSLVEDMFQTDELACLNAHPIFLVALWGLKTETDLEALIDLSDRLLKDFHPPKNSVGNVLTNLFLV